MLAGALGFAGSALAGGLSYFGQKSANKANIASAREAMDFQERMSNTSYQRSMEDMRKAGLNPILAAKLGGASTPGGVSAQSQNELGGAVSSALEARRLKADLELIRENTKMAALNQDIARKDVFLREANTLSQAGLNNAIAAKNLAETTNIEYDSALKKLEHDLYSSDFGSLLRVIEKIPGLGGLVSGAGSNLFKKAPKITKIYK